MRRWIGMSMVLAACGGESSSGGGNTPDPAPAEGTPAGTTPEDDATLAAPIFPVEWVLMQAKCGYTFHAPPEMTALESQGTDSCLDTWATTRCRYSGDYGGFSSDLSEYLGQPEFDVVSATIGGYVTRVVTGTTEDGRHIVSVSFPEADPEAPGVRLTVWASCEDVAGQHEARRVFETIQLGVPGSNAPN